VLVIDECSTVSNPDPLKVFAKTSFKHSCWSAISFDRSGRDFALLRRGAESCQLAVRQIHEGVTCRAQRVKLARFPRFLGCDSH